MSLASTTSLIVTWFLPRSCGARLRRIILQVCAVRALCGLMFLVCMLEHFLIHDAGSVRSVLPLFVLVNDVTRTDSTGLK